VKLPGIVWLAGIVAAFYYLAPKRDEAGPAIAVMPDVGQNYPPIYPAYTGSGALDPTGSQWPGWNTPPFNPEGYPGGMVETGYGDMPQSIVAPAPGEPIDPSVMY